MFVFTVVGMVHSTGTVREGPYAGQPYDNQLLHCVRPSEESRSHEKGEITEIFKIKSSLLDSSIGIGDSITVLYDRFGRPSEVRKV